VDRPEQDAVRLCKDHSLQTMQSQDTVAQSSEETSKSNGQYGQWHPRKLERRKIRPPAKETPNHHSLLQEAPHQRDGRAPGFLADAVDTSVPQLQVPARCPTRPDGLALYFDADAVDTCVPQPQVSARWPTQQRQNQQAQQQK
jgi:hypothetical protein